MILSFEALHDLLMFFVNVSSAIDTNVLCASEDCDDSFKMMRMTILMMKMMVMMVMIMMGMMMKMMKMMVGMVVTYWESFNENRLFIAVKAFAITLKYFP